MNVGGEAVTPVMATLASHKPQPLFIVLAGAFAVEQFLLGGVGQNRRFDPNGQFVDITREREPG